MPFGRVVMAVDGRTLVLVLASPARPRCAPEIAAIAASDRGRRRRGSDSPHAALRKSESELWFRGRGAFVRVASWGF